MRKKYIFSFILFMITSCNSEGEGADSESSPCELNRINAEDADVSPEQIDRSHIVVLDEYWQNNFSNRLSTLTSAPLTNQEIASLNLPVLRNKIWIAVNSSAYYGDDYQSALNTYQRNQFPNLYYYRNSKTVVFDSAIPFADGFQKFNFWYVLAVPDDYRRFIIQCSQ